MPSDLYNNEAEQYLLAAILRNPNAYFDINTVGLVPEDFVNRDHARIFGAIINAVEDKVEPSIPYVIENIRLGKRADTVSYISELTTVPCSVEQALDHARVVKSLAVARNLGMVGAKIIDIATERRTDYNSALVDSERLIREISLSLPEQERSPSAADILSRMEGEQESRKIPITFSSTMQTFTGGMPYGHFWVVGAFSSTGKSAFVTNMALDALRAGKTVAIVSAEMTQEQYMIRMLSIDSGVPQQNIAGRVTIGIDNQKALVASRQRLAGYNLFVYDNLYRLPQIRTELFRLKNLKGLDMVVIDYIQNISVTGDEVSDAREVALESQRLAKDLDVFMLDCSQLSNAQAKYEIEGGDDEYYSLKGHGSIRDAADAVFTLHRDRRSQSSALKVKWRKHRHGAMSDFICHFDLPTGRIEEIAWEDAED